MVSEALRMPLAKISDFVNPEDFPHDADPKLIKISKSGYIRSHLIARRYAVGLQSPIGRSGKPSIFRLYPDGDAPALTNASKGSRKRKQARRKYVAQTTAAAVIAIEKKPQSKNGKILPTIEDLAAIIARVREIEGPVTRDSIDAEMLKMRNRISIASIEDILSLSKELSELAQSRNEQSLRRKEALTQLSQDETFQQRDFLHLIAV